MRVLLLSAYDAQSHRHWHSSLREGISDWHWTVLSLPPRHFAWRIRGNPLTWAIDQRPILEQGYDLVLATSMVDLATLRGLVPALASIPTVLYFHENQFAYPRDGSRHGPVEAQMVSLYAALAADALLFNSNFNQLSFLDGCRELLGRLPDAVPAGVVERLADKSAVIPVPLAGGSPAAVAPADKRLQLLWNHRWEYDKGPDLLLRISQLLAQSGQDFVLHVVGQQFRKRPAVFGELEKLLRAIDSLGAWGFREDRQDYWSLLGVSDVVLSTADHDFQGLSVLEACAAGCTPLVPDRLVYPEWFDGRFRYRDAEQAADAIAGYCAGKASGEALPTMDVCDFSAAALIPRYRSHLLAVAA